MQADLRSRIEGLHAEGVSAPEIGRQLGVAATTVSYHLARLCQERPADDPGAAAAGAPAGALARSTTRERVAALLGQGQTKAQIADALGLSPAAISYHVRRLGHTVDERCARRYDWGRVQTYYDAGHTVRECMDAFGFSSASWFQAVKRGAVVARPARLSMGDLLRADTYRGRYHLKARLIAEGLKTARCELCGLTEWRGQPITLALHHVNGTRNDNRLSNLQLLCPNCHSQTDTFAGRNGRRAGAA